MARYILATGGTGGHIFPALAVAEEIRRRDSSIELLFIGSLYGPEASLAARANIPFLGLNVRGFLGRGPRAIGAAFRLGAAFMHAFGTVRKFRPSAVAGFGGYASFAPVMAAHFLKIPILLHEQNAVAGASNRFLARYAAKKCVSLPDTAGLSDVVLTGNPVRADICVSSGSRPGARHLLVLGGSQGAHALNAFMVEILPALKEAGISVRHQCGKKDYEKVREAYAASGMNPDSVYAFMDDMPAQYAWADMAFCRSGASTVAELCACGVPAVFTPFPAAIHDHQTLNAQAVAANGGAIIIPERDLEKSRMVNLFTEMLGDKVLLQKMSMAAHSLAKPDAASLLVDELESLSH